MDTASRSARRSGDGSKRKSGNAGNASNSAQMGLAAPHGPQHDVILLHQSTGFALAVPIRSEVEMRLDFDYDKPRVSLIMLVL
jgi:hypothetical protein